jgi:hypothetical protein
MIVPVIVLTVAEILFVVTQADQKNLSFISPVSGG